MGGTTDGAINCATPNKQKKRSRSDSEFRQGNGPAYFFADETKSAKAQLILVHRNGFTLIDPHGDLVARVAMHSGIALRQGATPLVADKAKAG